MIQRRVLVDLHTAFTVRRSRQGCGHVVSDLCKSEGGSGSLIQQQQMCQCCVFHQEIKDLVPSVVALLGIYA